MMKNWKSIGMCLAIVGLGWATAAQALDSSWTNTASGFWEIGSNWSAGAPTSSLSTVYITNGVSKSVTISSPLPLGTLTISNLVLSAPTGAQNILAIGNLTNGPFRILNNCTISAGGIFQITGAATVRLDNVSSGGVFTDNGSVTVAAGVLNSTNIYTYVGTGTFSVIGGTWLGGQTTVGAGGSGILNISSGLADLNGNLTFGFTAGSTGSVWVNGGQLMTTGATAAVRVGYSGVGQITVSNGTWVSKATNDFGYSDGEGRLRIAGGTVDLQNTVNIGKQTGTTGAVWMTGGSLFTTNTYISIGGNGGYGTFTQSNGTWTSGGFWGTYIGSSNTSFGSYTLVGGTNQNTSFDGMIVGFNGGTGQAWVKGGFLNVPGGIQVGYASGGQGSMTISGGLVRTSYLSLAGYSSGAGTLTVAGGQLETTSTYSGLGTGSGFGTINVLGGTVIATNGSISIAAGDNGYGYMTIGGGSVLAGTFQVGGGVNSSGYVTQTGGTVVVNSVLEVGGFWDFSSGSYSQSGGLLYVTNGVTRIGRFFPGNLTFSYGASAYLGDVVMGSNGVLTLSYYGSPNVHLLGTLVAGTGTSGSGSIDFSGGTLFIEPTGFLQLGSNFTTINSTITNRGVLQTFAPLISYNGGFGNEGQYSINTGQYINMNTLRNELAGTLYLNNGILDVTGVWTNAGAVEFALGGNLRGASVYNTGLLEGSGRVDAPVINADGGTIRAANGLLHLAGTSIQNQPGAYLEAAPGGTLRISRTLVNQGIVNPQGGVIDLLSNSLTNQGTLTGFGTYKAKEIVNDGRALFNGQVNFQSTYINNATRTTEVRYANASFFGAVTNNAGGVFKNTGSDIVFFNTFFNNGTYVSDPATNTFNATLALGPAGKLAGGEGDVFVVNSHLLITNPNGLDIAEATLAFGGGAHEFTLAGTAHIGTLSLADGATVVLTGGDLIVGFFGADASQFTTAQTIYYDPVLNPDLGGQTYALTGGGTLAVVPEPGTWTMVLVGVAALVSSAVRKKRA